MLSPIRQRALVRELRHLVDRADQQEEISRSYPHDTPHGVITPPYTPVPSIHMDLIPTTRLPTQLKDTGDIDMNITAQEDKQTNEQENEVPDQESVYLLIRELQEKLQGYQGDHNQQFPPVVRMGMHKFMPLHRQGVIQTVFRLAETNILVELDPKAGDAIQCCDA